MGWGDEPGEGGCEGGGGGLTLLFDNCSLKGFSARKFFGLYC